MVYMLSQERMGSPAAVVIDFVSMANQALAVTAIIVALRNEKERCVTRQNGCMDYQLPTSSADYYVVAKSISPKRG